jgi:hypothetical protein
MRREWRIRSVIHSSRPGTPHWGRLLPGSFTLALLLTGLTTSLLTLAGASLIGGDVVLREDPARSCTVFQIGSQDAAITRIHLENVGEERTSVDFHVEHESGTNPWLVGYSRSLAPLASIEVVFTTPPLGATLALVSSGRDLRLNTEIVRGGGTPPEIREPVRCLTGE